MYAQREKMVVTAKTHRSAIILTSLSSPPTAIIETALITSKLNDAEPTIVDGPSSGGTASISLSVEMTESKISGADEPSAISVKFATVSFQMATSMVTCSQLSSKYSYFLVYAVIDSMDSINMSEMMPMPTKR